jgi:uncharacterized membrane protein
MLAGFYTALFNAMRSNAYMVWADFFSVYRDCAYFGKLACLAALHTLLSALLFLLLIPGILFVIFTSIAIPLHKEQGLDAKGAITTSYAIIRRYCCSVFGFLICAALINFVGAICLGVGLFVTIPVTLLASSYMYHHLAVVNGVTILVNRNAPSMMPGAALNSPLYHTAMDAI